MRVDGTLSGAGADERVDLVDEQQDVAASLDLLEHLLQALFEVTAVAAAGHKRPEIEGVQLLVGRACRDVVVDDFLRKALDDGSLADTGLADEHRVVLRAAAERSACVRSSSFERPITGSSSPSRAAWVRLRPNWSRI